MKYFPFINGQYSTGPGLILMEKAVHPADAMVFQIDDDYDKYLANKQNCRQENIQKYYCENTLWTKTSFSVNWFIINKLIKEYPHNFILEKAHDDCRF